MSIVVLLRAPHYHPQRSEPLPALSPCDRAALTCAQTLASEGQEIVALTAAPESDEPVLELALRQGAHRAVRIWGQALDSCGLAHLCNVLSVCIRRLGEVTLTLAGAYSADWSSGAVGPGVAHFLGVPHLTGVVAAKLAEGRLLVDQLRGAQRLTISLALPALITVLNGPDSVSEREASADDIERWSLEDVRLEFEMESTARRAAPKVEPATQQPELGQLPEILARLRASGLLP